MRLVKSRALGNGVLSLVYVPAAWRATTHAST
jgi:hypothetical protein